MARMRSSEIRRGGQAGQPHQFFFPPEYWPGGRTVMFFSGCVWNATGGGQRPVALAREFSRMGWTVLYYNWDDAGYWWAGGPLVLSRQTISEMMPALKKVGGLLVCGLPSPLFYEPAAELQRSGWVLLYDTIDDWEAFHTGGDATWYERDCELAFLNESDILTASAPSLAKKMKSWSGRSPVLVRNAGPSSPIPACAPPADMRLGTDGTVVYVGYLYGRWFNWTLLERTALDLPEVTFNIVGDNARLKLPKLNNLNFVGAKPYPVAMQYVQHSQASIIPFQGTQLSAGVDPIKYYDAMAAGIPTVATGCLTDLQGRENVVLAPRRATTLAPAIREALKMERWPRHRVAKWLMENSWTARAQAMMSLCEEAVT